MKRHFDEFSCDECSLTTTDVNEVNGWYSLQTFITMPTLEMLVERGISPDKVDPDTIADELPDEVVGDFCTLACVANYASRKSFEVDSKVKPKAHVEGDTPKSLGQYL
jgi:hypothetical protein